MAKRMHITTEDAKNLYFQMPKGHRSIRKLHKQLSEKYKGKKSIPSLTTLFRYSKEENWIEQSHQIDNQVSENTMQKIVEKKTIEMEELTDKLKQTSESALQSVIDAFNSGIGSKVEKVQDLLNMTKVGVESAKLSNLLQGNPTSISGSVQIDDENVINLKKHIAELYQSINEDLVIREQQEVIKKLN